MMVLAVSVVTLLLGPWKLEPPGQRKKTQA